MSSKYRHGGGYIQAAKEEGIDNVTDYSTSINWKAVEFFPEQLIYSHYENIEYPNPEYPDLKEIIENIHQIPAEYFVMTHGANEAISSLFQAFRLKEYHKSKKIILIGPTYGEYDKYAELNGFNITRTSFDALDNNDLINNIVIIVNPNTPYGFYFDIKSRIKEIMQLEAIVIVDESFIDFTEKPSCLSMIKENPNLYIIHSLTKFYGAPGARLGLLISSNPLLQNLIAKLLPHWTLSSYDKWFYKIIIIKYNNLKKETLKWIKEINSNLEEILKNSKNLKLFAGSTTCYHTIELNSDFIKENKINNLQKFFLRNYKIYIRPAADFYGCSEASFRVGLRLQKDNLALFSALKDIS